MLKPLNGWACRTPQKGLGGAGGHPNETRSDAAADADARRRDTPGRDAAASMTGRPNSSLPSRRAEGAGYGATSSASPRPAGKSL